MEFAKSNNLHIKETDKLYMIYFKHDDIIDESNEHVRKCKGIILEKGTDKIVCYTSDKYYDNLNQLSEIKWIEDCIDGTQIRVFYYDGKWNYSTTRCIDADRSYWYSSKSFRTLFMESCTTVRDTLANACETASISGYDESRLDKNKCYSFILCHPENRIVIKYDKPMLYHVLTRDMTTLEIIDDDIGVPKPTRYYNQTIDELLLAANDAMKMGFIVCDKDGKKAEIQTDNYKMVRELRGNSNNLFYHYLCLRKSGLVDAFLKYYGEYSDAIEKYEQDLLRLFNLVYHTYVSRYIKKEIDSSPSYMKNILYLIHGEYIRTGSKVNFYKVVDIMNELDPKQICFLYNKYAFWKKA